MAGHAVTVGVIGVGVMGSSMAAHLLDAGFEVVGYDIDPDRLAELATRGGVAAASCADAVQAADVVITSLPSVEAFDQSVAEIAGVGPAGLLVADTSTLPLDAKEKARHLLSGQGVTLLDCPLSGTGQQARTKDVVVLASGDHTGIERLRPVFVAFARTVHEVGDFGAGSKLKLVANLLVAIHNVAAAEALLLARATGLDLGMVLEVISDGAGTSRMFEIRGPLMATKNFEPGIATRTFQKDVEIIASFAEANSCPTPLFSVAAQVYEAALAQGRGNEDTACVYEVLAAMGRD